MKPSRRSDRPWLTPNVFYMGLVSLLSDASHEMATAILPFFLALDLGAGAGVLGLIEGASDGASSFVKSYAGYRSDRAGRRKPFMELGYSMTAIFKPMIALATAWPQVLLLRMSAWVGRGVRGPPRDALLADSAEPTDVGKAFGFQRALDTAGAVLGPALALFLVLFVSYRTIFVLSAIPGIAAVIVVFLKIREVDRPRTRVGEIADHRYNAGFIDSMKSLPKPFKKYLFAVGTFGMGNFANSLFSLRAQQVLAPVYGAGRASAVAIALYVLLNLVYASASFPVGALVDKIGRKGVLVTGYFISAATCLETAFLVPDLLLLAVVFASAGLFTAITDTVEGTMAADLLQAKSRGTGFGVLQTVNGLGDFISSAVVGVLWTSFSPELAFAYAALLSTLGGLFLLRTPTRSGHAAAKAQQEPSI